MSNPLHQDASPPAADINKALARTMPPAILLSAGLALATSAHPWRTVACIGLIAVWVRTMFALIMRDEVPSLDQSWPRWRTQLPALGRLLLAPLLVLSCGDSLGSWVIGVPASVATGFMAESRRLPHYATVFIGTLVGSMAVVGVTPQVIATAFVTLTLLTIVSNAMARIIRDRKVALDEALEAVAHQEAFSQLVFANVPDLVFVKDAQFRIVAANPAFLSLYPPETRDDVIGTTTLEQYDEQEREAFLAEDRRAFETGFSEVEERIHFPDASLRTLLTKKVRFVHADGTPYILGIARDVSTSREQAEALRAAQERLQLSIDGSRDGLWDWDMLTNDVTYTGRYRELLGYDPDDIDAFPNGFGAFESHLHPDDAATHQKALKEHLEDGADYDFEHRLRTASGHYRYYRAKGRALRDSGGRPVRMAGSFTDIHEQKMLELELRRAREAAEAGVQAKSAFLATMSHEIRTPMNGVLGMLELLSSSGLDEAQRRYADVAMSSAQSLLTLVNDVLDFSKIEAGKVELERAEFDVRTLIGDVAESVARLAQDKGVEVVVDLAGLDARSVVGDAARFRQVLSNLVSNALKFTQEGHVIVTGLLDTVAGSSGRHQLVCEVRDTGIGIPADKLDGLFDAFTQADSSTTRKFGGTGLGLSICKSLSELMGGTLVAESVLGEGSTFRISVPIELPAGAALGAGRQRWRGQSVWLVERDTVTQGSVARQLAAWGAEVRVYDGPELLIAGLQSRSPLPGLVLLDEASVGHMPALAEVLRGLEGRRPVIAATVSMRTAREEAIQGPEGMFTLPRPVVDRDFALVHEVTLASKRSTAGGAEGSQEATPAFGHTAKAGGTEGDGVAGPGKGPLVPASEVRVLMVEDNRVNQMVACGMLKKMGVQVEVAGDGAQALERLCDVEAGTFDLILMDCQMPVLDGYEATKAIRAGVAGAAAAALPIVAMTANALTGDREACLAAGMDDYVAKPISFQALSATVGKWARVARAA